MGDQLRNSQPHMWHWRDWIVESLNNDLPYDEMVRLMLAADELHPNDLDRLRASGFLARNYFLFNRNQWMDETVEHVSKAFLGLTMNCSKCHDHKYDPFEQADYYRLRAFFEPYHVRMEMLPGEIDLTRNGLPRAFDAYLEQPTYRFVRGEESQPDKSLVLTPGLPKIFDFHPLKIEPIALPAEAWQPERRSWVQEAYLTAAKKTLAAAEVSVETAKRKLADLQAKQLSPKEIQPAISETNKEGKERTDASSAPAGFVDQFEKLDPKRWQLLGGDWKHEAGKLAQRKDGAQRAALWLLGEVPQDFEAVVRFRILGGSRWRSVGINFDSTQHDPKQPAKPEDSEQMVYLSAVAGGSKLQAAFGRGGKHEYPQDGMIPLPVELDREYTLRLQVRGQLVNASLNGEPLLAWKSPLMRRAGALQLTTFDALAVFHEFSLSPLAENVVLREPQAQPAATPLLQPVNNTAAEAELALQIAESERAVAEAELAGVEAKQAILQLDPQDMERVKAQTDTAIQAARRSAVAQATRNLKSAELKKLRAAPDKQAASEKELTTAREALTKAEKALTAPIAPTDRITPLVGAKWSATRFRSSGADDPAPTFPTQSSGRRKALAEWITDRKNPLTARVAVNHIWARHFGTPLVASVFEFGRKASPPTHPELLDWLAAEFIASGWSMKHLHRLIVGSATYQMSSSNLQREANLQLDPDNLQLWRRSPQRLESQAIRDALLTLAGTLDLTRGGPPVKAAEQAESRRRSLYFFHSNNERNLLLTTFDDALVKECYRREQSIVPQQALALTNSRLVHDSAKLIAAELSKNSAGDSVDEAQFIRRAFAVLLGMEPTAHESAASAKALSAWRQMPGSSEAVARTNFVWALVNHNDFVTLR